MRYEEKILIHEEERLVKNVEKKKINRITDMEEKGKNTTTGMIEK